MPRETETNGTTVSALTWQAEWSDWWQGYWSDAPVARVQSDPERAHFVIAAPRAEVEEAITTGS